jgi:NitT/TauT family transport system ATP-binding protein
VASILAVPNRAYVAADVIKRTLCGSLKVSPDGMVRESDRYLMVGRQGAARPDPVQMAWLYAQMVRWGQAPLSAENLALAKSVVRPDIFDAALSGESTELSGEPVDGVGAFTGPLFNADDIAGYLSSWSIKRRSRCLALWPGFDCSAQFFCIVLPRQANLYTLHQLRFADN